MSLDWEFVARWISIVVLDLTLAGDNAVVIALAVRTLPKKQQRLGIFWGAMAAVALRVAVTFVDDNGHTLMAVTRVPVSRRASS